VKRINFSSKIRVRFSLYESIIQTHLLSEIRVTYSGLIGLVVGLISIVTGLVFSLVITRTLSPEQYGTWSLIGSIVAYFIISETVISFWTIRQIARGEEVGKTAVITSGFFSLGIIPLYLAYIYLISGQSNVDQLSMIFGLILIPVYFISQTLAAINRGHKPHAKSFGMLTFETLKIPTILVFVYFLELGVEGVIIAVTLAYIAKIGVQIFFAKPKLAGIFRLNTIKRWFKLSWLPFYFSLHRFIQNLDIVLYLVIVGSVLGLAYYHAALIIAGILVNAGMVSQGLLPKLLSGGKHAYIRENFLLLMYIAIPLLAISIIFSRPTLFALNPVYEVAYIVVIFLAFKTFFATLNSFYYNILTGIETVDVEENPSYSKLLQSKLFSIPTIALVQSTAYLVSTVLVIFILNSYGFSEIELVTWWSLISLLTQIPFTFYLWNQVRKNVELVIPYISIAKYTTATFAFIIVYIFTSDFIIKYEISIYDFLPGLLIQALICVSIYLSITYLIDERTRRLFKSVTNEFKTILKRKD